MAGVCAGALSFPTRLSGARAGAGDDVGHAESGRRSDPLSLRFVVGGQERDLLVALRLQACQRGLGLLDVVLHRAQFGESSGVALCVHHDP